MPPALAVLGWVVIALAASATGGAAPTRAELEARAAAPTMPPATAATMSANYDALCKALDPQLQSENAKKLHRAQFSELLASEGAVLQTDM